MQWSDQGMQSSFKFIQKFWGLHCKLKDEYFVNSKEEESISETLDDKEINVFTNEIIYKITYNLENFHYNVIIANLHEIYNFLNKLNLKKKINLSFIIYRVTLIKIIYIIFMTIMWGNLLKHY